MKNHTSKKVSLPTIKQVEKERKELKRKKEFNKTVRNIISVLIVVAAIAVLVATLLLPVLQISGTSMQPTLNDDEIVVLVKTNKVDSGELIGFYYQSKILLKRVIGQPGDIINITADGTVSVNGETLEEPYISGKELGDCDIQFPFQVPEGKYFVLGDHRETSIDSRSSVIGCVGKDQIIGEVAVRVWPLREFSFI